MIDFIASRLLTSYRPSDPDFVGFWPPNARPGLQGNRPDGELNVLYNVAEHVRALEAALPLA